MADSFERLGIVSSYSEASRSSRSRSGSSFPSDFSLGKKCEWSLEEACSEILKNAASCKKIPLAALTTKNYTCSEKDIEFLATIFGQPVCSSPWKRRLIDMMFIVFLFIVIVGLIIFLGPSSIKETPWTWLFILVLFVIALFFLNWWSMKSSDAVCQI